MKTFEEFINESSLSFKFNKNKLTIKMGTTLEGETGVAFKINEGENVILSKKQIDNFINWLIENKLNNVL